MFLLFLKKINLTKIINSFFIYFSYIISVVLKKQIRWGLPFSMSVEPTNLCNLNCPECAAGNRSMTRKSGYISFNLYKKVIDQSYKYLLNLFFYFQGEPFIYENIFEMIEYAVKKNIFSASSTNAHFLTPENAEKIVKSGLDKLIISLDGTTQKVYEKYRVGGNIEKVKAGIKNIVEAKKSLNSKTPIVEIQFIVFKHNEHQIEDIKIFCKKYKTINLKFKSAQINNLYKNSYLIPKKTQYRRYKFKNSKWVLKKKLRNRCFRLWNSVVITWEGIVLPCCFDKNANYPLGDIKNQNLAKIVNGNKFKIFAKRLQSNRKSINICRNCTE